VPRISSIILLTIFAVCSLQAQIAGGLSDTTSSNWGGNNYITGAILWPNGTSANTKISITLQSQTRGEILAMTDDNGKFVFSRIPPGLYTIVFEGDSQFERASQEVEVLRNSASQTVAIRLRYRPSTDSKPAVINSEYAGVPKKAIDFYNKGIKLVNSKDIKGAVDQLKLAVAEYPEFVLAFNELGIQYMQLNELEKADESLRAALKIKPDAFEPMMNRGIVLYRMKKFDKSEPVLRSALTLNQKSAVGHFYLGRLLVNLERLDEAEKEFNLALSLSENKMIEVHRMLANLYITRDEYKRAADELEKYLKLNPKAPDAEQLKRVLSELKNLKLPDPKP